MPAIEPYERSSRTSYALGIYPALSLLDRRPECAERLLLDERGESSEGAAKLAERCGAMNVRIEYAPRALKRISGKDNCYAGIEFDKARACEPIRLNAPHVALVQPSDQGNLGSILRSIAGLGLSDLAIIGGGVDPFDPHVVRASMGALFSVRISLFDEFNEYLINYPAHASYPFMLDASRPLPEVARNHPPLYSLIFGNEGAGLPASFASIGQAVRIPQTNAIDSLNLAAAVSIGAYAFTQGNTVEVT